MKKSTLCFLPQLLLGILVAGSTVLYACGADTSTSPAACEGDACDEPAPAEERPAGWTEESHGKEAAPSYDTVFPQGVVNRVDITISAEDWQEMLDDLTRRMGPFGTGGLRPPAQEQTQPAQQNPAQPAPAETSPKDEAQGDGPPREVFEACVGKEADDPCTVVLDGQQLDSHCAPLMGQQACLPQKNDPVDQPPAVMDDNPIFVPCTLSFEGKTWNHVGIRAKGNSSLATAWSGGNYKLPLRLDFDEFEDQYPEIDDQRFYGFKKLSLNNGFSDDSLIREKVMYDLLRSSGVPAPRAAFYRVYVDHGEGATYFGLYTVVEVPDDPLLESQLSGSGGNLYKPDGPGADWTGFDAGSFPKKTNEEEADFSDIEGAIAALHASRQDAAAWRADLEARLDVDGFLNWLAVNTLVQNWDCYGAYAHNYYLYTDPGDGRLRWIPWDNNESFMETRSTPSLTLEEVGDGWPLIRYLMDDPQYEAAYYSHLEAFAAGPFAQASLDAQLTAEYALVSPYAVGAEGENAEHTNLKGPEAFEGALSELLDHVARRRQDAAAVLGQR